MINLIAVLLTAILSFIAALHAYWALGGVWPGRDKSSLGRIVVGNPRLLGVPPASLTAIVAALIAGAAAWPLLLSPVTARIASPEIARIMTGLLAIVFLLRGLAGYLPVLQRRHSAEPFASLNRVLYSPLCLALGAGFLILAFSGGAGQ